MATNPCDREDFTFAAFCLLEILLSVKILTFAPQKAFPIGKVSEKRAHPKPKIPDRERSVNANRLLTRQKSTSASVTTGFPANTNQQVRDGR